MDRGKKYKMKRVAHKLDEKTEKKKKKKRMTFTKQSFQSKERICIREGKYVDM